jgi:hypothetical protein
MAIALLFEQLSTRENSKNDPWSVNGGHDGISAIVKKNLYLSSGTNTATVFQDYLVCRAAGIKYTGKQSVTAGKTMGQPTVLAPDSTEAQICANTQEEGFSVTMTWYAVNQHCRESGQPSVTKAAIIGLLQSLKPKINKIIKVSQGNRDPSSTWAVARWLFLTQFLIRLCQMPSQTITIKAKNDNNKEVTFIPDYWNSDLLTAINLSQVAWWDEIHRRCKIGGVSAANDCFPTCIHNKDGALDHNGEYSTKVITQLKVKYQKKTRLCLGVAAVQEDNDDSKLEGKRLKPFVYSNKVILSSKD